MRNTRLRDDSRSSSWLRRAAGFAVGAFALAPCTGDGETSSGARQDLLSSNSNDDVEHVGAPPEVPDSPAQWARDATVAVAGRCTGTLVSPRVVLTAAHCL